MRGRIYHHRERGDIIVNVYLMSYFRPGSGTRNQIPNIIPSASQCSYAACYCEENVYKICQAIRDSREGGPEELAKAWVVFVSNKKRVVPLWRQKAGKDEEKLVIWDYHAVLIYRPDHRCSLMASTIQGVPKKSVNSG